MSIFLIICSICILAFSVSILRNLYLRFTKKTSFPYPNPLHLMENVYRENEIKEWFHFIANRAKKKTVTDLDSAVNFFIAYLFASPNQDLFYDFITDKSPTVERHLAVQHLMHRQNLHMNLGLNDPDRPLSRWFAERGLTSATSTTYVIICEAYSLLRGTMLKTEDNIRYAKEKWEE